MPAANRTRKGLAGTRRRLHDEGEEEEGAPDLNSDSQSEASSATDIDDVASSNASDTEELEEQDSQGLVTAGTVENTHLAVNATASRADAGRKMPAARAEGAPTFKTTAETDAMLNGLTLEDGAQEEDAIQFEDSAGSAAAMDSTIRTAVPVPPPAEKKRETLAERRNREHEEYNQKREVDPAFVPNRGGFFMHDQRNSNFGTPGQSLAGRGRGRGGPNAMMGAPRPQPQPTRPAMDRWTHDLHETVANPRVPDVRPQPSQPIHRPQNIAEILPPSKSIAIGTVMVKISLGNGKPSGKPLKMTVRQHTRLPDPRPPLRRDKPVRVFVPGQSARYVFPSPDRSFIFIPRSQHMRQQPAGPQARAVPPQIGSRRQSTLATSTYAASSASRRSSVLQEKPEFGIQPAVNLSTGSVPSSAPYMPHMDSAIVSPVYMQGHSHPPPAQPLRQEARRMSLPMHQPRPQKQVSLATIDSPSSMQAPQTQEQAPFHQQVPPNVNGTSSSEPMTNRQHSLQGQQYPIVTPLSVIPEVTANAQSFQPGMPASQGYYPQQYPAQPMYYYPHPPGASHGQYPVAPYGGDTPYYMPFFGQGQAQVHDMGDASAASQYAHESNGMVYYYDPNVPASEGQMYNFQQPTAGEGFYYGQDQMSNQMYYPTQ